MMLGPILVQMRKGYPSHAVVTGGEPMIAPEIKLITQRLKEHEYHITIETAGTVYEDVTCDLMSISPKLKNSTPWKREKGRYAEHHERTRYQPDVLKKLISQYEHQLKFVVMKPEDLLEVRQIVNDIGAKTVECPVDAGRREVQATGGTFQVDRPGLPRLQVSVFSPPPHRHLGQRTRQIAVPQTSPRSIRYTHP